MGLGRGQRDVNHISSTCFLKERKQAGQAKSHQIWVRALCSVSSVCFEVFIKEREIGVQFIPGKIINILNDLSMCDAW